VRAWRIVNERWLQTAFSGEGARILGGRWNGKGTRIVYLADSLALAALELLVHIDHSQALKRHWAIPVEFTEESFARLASEDLPARFPDLTTLTTTQRIGDAWVRAGATPLLRVPSAVVTLEFNYLFNPDHELARNVKIGEAVPFRFDERLARKPRTLRENRGGKQ